MVTTWQPCDSLRFAVYYCQITLFTKVQINIDNSMPYDKINIYNIVIHKSLRCIPYLVPPPLSNPLLLVRMF